MSAIEFPKRDMTVIYGGRTFALRAYHQEGEWRGVIIEKRTPLPNWLAPATEPAAVFAAAVALIAAVVDSASGAQVSAT